MSPSRWTWMMLQLFLRNVKALNMSYSSLSNIPQTLLSDDTEFIFSHNQISTIDDGVDFLDVESVVFLDASHNQLQHFPKLHKFKNTLETLILDNNHVSEVPLGYITGYTALTQLSCNNNMLSALPSFDNTLNNLVILLLARNKISDLSIDVPIKIRELDLTGNEISSIPDNFYQHLQHISILRLDYNQIDQFPAIQQLEKIQHLFISHNKLTKFPVFTDTATYIETIIAAYNDIISVSGSLPRSVTTLDLQHNRIGPINSTFLKDAVHVTTISIGDNAIIGELPNVTYLERISLLNFSFNTLETVNFDDFQHTAIEILDLSYNRISSTLTYVAKTLRHLSLNNNKIIHIAPGAFDNCTQLHSVLLDHNDLISFPRLSAQLPKLHSLSLSHNKLDEFYLDDFIGSPLSKLLIDNNDQLTMLHLHGIPDTLKTLEVKSNPNLNIDMIGPSTSLTTMLFQGIKYFNVSYMNGTLFPELQVMFLENVNMHVAPNLEDLTLTKLMMEKNYLTKFPVHLPVTLLFLGLEYNQLTEIPPSIAKLTRLRRLYINDNNLTGLPQLDHKLYELTILNMNRNFQLVEFPNVFEFAPDTQFLYLKSCALQIIDKSRLSSLRNIRRLFLSFNRISVIGDIDFSNSLQTHISVRLNDNQLAYIPPPKLSSILKRVEITVTDIVCDDKMAWILIFNNIELQGTCKTRERGTQDIKNLNMNDFFKVSKVINGNDTQELKVDNGIPYICTMNEH